MMSMSMGSEIIYSFVIIFCSLLVYFGTKELYELSSHKGIKYFRQAFLFFAIAYFFRSLIKFLVISFNLTEIVSFSYFFFGPLSLLLFVYFSSMGIFYLLYSVLWKKIGENKIYFFHILAIFLAAISLFFRDLYLNLAINLFLLFFVAIAFLIAHKNSKKKKVSMYVIYLLFLIFWSLNIIDTLVPNFFRTFQIFINLSSISIFLIILYKVLKKSG
jgi:hypothetical protein